MMKQYLQKKYKKENHRRILQQDLNKRKENYQKTLEKNMQYKKQNYQSIWKKYAIQSCK